MQEAALIAIDWGTTSARAYAVDRHDAILAERSAPLGVQQVSDARFPEALALLLGDWKDWPVPRVAAGMVGSRQGWIEAPYVECPASFESLASRIVATPGCELSIVPGLISHDAGGVPDVMRGEETQLAGVVAAGEEIVAVLPGTHSKWAAVSGGRVVEFTTYMTGELYGVLLGHSILGRLADPSARPRLGAAFEAGVARGLGEGGLGHRIFAARSLGLTGMLAAADVGDYLSGILIGDEIASARKWAARRMPQMRVRVIGADALVERYVRALELVGIACERGPSDAAVRGIARLARLAGRLH